MQATPIEPIPEKTVKRSSLWDVLWYILCGFGLFTVAGLLLGFLMHGKTGSLLFSVLVYVSNVLFLGGTALVMGAGRGKFSLAEIGLVPPRWRWTWLAVAVPWPSDSVMSPTLEVPSPQWTMAEWVSRMPGSENVPTKLRLSPSLPTRSLADRIVGATLFTLTWKLAEPTPPSSSVTSTSTVYGPSSR